MVQKGASLMLITGSPINWKCCGLSLRQIKVRAISRSPFAPPFPSLSFCLSYIFIYLLYFTNPKGPVPIPPHSTISTSNAKSISDSLLPHKRLPPNFKLSVNEHSSRGIYLFVLQNYSNL